MKPSNLSLAILIALGATACGGSGDGTTPTPADPPRENKTAPQPENQTEQRDDRALVDPTYTHVVDNRDLTKESTVGGLQYIRRDASDYDRFYNPDKRASATPLLGVDLNEQNPQLSNIVLARRDLEHEENKAVRAQFAGNIEPKALTGEGKAPEHESLQIENFKNVDILAGAYKQVGSAKFDDPDSRIGPDKNIGTHIQNNVDSEGNITRERVQYVYTPRYEYRQPYVDYPNLSSADPLTTEFEASDTSRYTAADAPVPPSLINRLGNNIDRLQNFLIASAGGSADGITYNHNDNSRHPVNTGTGKDYAWGSFDNEEQKYGNFKPGGSHYEDDSPVDPASSAPASAWRNQGNTTGLTADHHGANYAGIAGNTSGTGAGTGYNQPARENNVVDWTKGNGTNYGAYTGSPGFTKRIDRSGGATGSGKTYDYQKPYPGGAYPKYPKALFAYPNKPYDEANNNALNAPATKGINNDVKDHEHIYLEREDFTAIREYKSIRPLVNPVAHEWDWTLHNEWYTTYATPYQDWHDEEVMGYDNQGNWRRIGWNTVWGSPGTLTSGWPDPGNDDAPYTFLSSAAGKARNETSCTSNSPGNGGSGRMCGGTTFTTQLNVAEWVDPKNEGGGQRGEFRGPEYTGWQQYANVVRYADDRIWNKGADGYKPEYKSKYGANLIWWSTQDSAFENHATSNGWEPRARRVDINTETGPDCATNNICGEGKEDLVWANNTNNGNIARDVDVEIQPTGDITNGLIRIDNLGGFNTPPGAPKKFMPTLGEEMKFDGSEWKDHHKTSTRIFGHYHLAYANVDNRQVKAMGLNSYSGARSFVAKVEKLTADGRPDLDSKALEYSIGAQPITLQKVQYGRVTSNLDLTASGANLFPNGFLRAPFAKKGTDDSVDNYFFRGVDATTIEQMNALPSDQVASYEGHALMYGIDNSFHGSGPGNLNLPNAFGRPAGEGTLGLGNFVEAKANFGTRKVTGSVYNAFLQEIDKPGVYKDRLVNFEGDIIGNTVIGTADRVYVPEDDKADFRAAFFGSQADEMGGSFNSVKATDKYGSAYDVGDWGGVFGAAKVATNTFQADDGGNTYGGTTGAPQADSGNENRYAP